MSVEKVIVSFHIRLVMNTLIECVVSLCFRGKTGKRYLSFDEYHYINRPVVLLGSTRLICTYVTSHAKTFLTVCRFEVYVYSVLTPTCFPEVFMVERRAHKFFSWEWTRSFKTKSGNPLFVIFHP